MWKYLCALHLREIIFTLYRANTARIRRLVRIAYLPGYGKKKEIPYENISRRRSETRVVAAYGFALGCSEGEVRTVWK